MMEHFYVLQKKIRTRNTTKGIGIKKAKKIVFKDKNGQYRMFINKDSLILEQQPFKPQGMELIYLRKHSEK